MDSGIVIEQTRLCVSQKLWRITCLLVLELQRMCNSIELETGSLMTELLTCQACAIGDDGIWCGYLIDLIGSDFCYVVNRHCFSG